MRSKEADLRPEKADLRLEIADLRLEIALGARGTQDGEPKIAL